ncbi:MAG: hypothetical protein Q7K57_49340 [Burkholderiaceae bacterium]|nr:hypothetical protein [Burkholderiaceae bacterium]
MATTSLKQRFQVWSADPTKNHISAQDYPTTLEGSKCMLEDVMWQAYEEGYKQCQADITAALAKMGK